MTREKLGIVGIKMVSFNMSLWFKNKIGQFHSVIFMPDFYGHKHVFLRSNCDIFVANHVRYRRPMLHDHKNQSKKYIL